MPNKVESPKQVLDRINAFLEEHHDSILNHYLLPLDKAEDGSMAIHARNLRGLIDCFADAVMDEKLPARSPEMDERLVSAALAFDYLKQASASLAGEESRRSKPEWLERAYRYKHGVNQQEELTTDDSRRIKSARKRHVATRKAFNRDTLDIIAMRDEVQAIRAGIMGWPLPELPSMDEGTFLQ